MIRPLAGCRYALELRVEASPSNGLEQFRQRYPQGLRNSVHHCQRNVLLAALDRSHVAPMESAFVGEPLLGEPLLLA